tara:strand:+ start:582 stop:1220 length:639 start_codon:yes stop_codon:yes gene_type:complete
MSYFNKPYMEFFDEGDPLTSSYPALLLWVPETSIIHNSISPEEIVRYEDISDKSSFHSQWNSTFNNVRWIKASSIATYYVEATFWVRYSDTSFSPNYVWLGTNKAENNYNTASEDATVRVFCEEEKRFTAVVSQTISGASRNMITTTAGTYAKLTMRFSYNANASSWSVPHLLSFVDSSATQGGMLGSALYGYAWPKKLYVYNRHVKLTKID